jgi:hypothetical protein
MAGKQNRRKKKMSNTPALAIKELVVTADSVTAIMTEPVNVTPQLIRAFEFNVIRRDSGPSPVAASSLSPSSGAAATLKFGFQDQFQQQDVIRVTFPALNADNKKALHGHSLPPESQYVFGIVSAESIAMIAAPAAAGGTGGTGNGSSKDVGIVAESFEDAITYPFLTEEVGLPPAPISGGGGGSYAGGGGGSGSKSSLGQSASQAITDVLGWRVNSNDPAGFVGALSQSFSLTEVEGHIESRWVPRTYAVQTDLAGGITGAQASLLFRMKDAVDQALPLIEGLTPLRRDPDWEYITAAKAVIKSQLQELVGELAMPGSLRVARVDQIFRILFEPALARLGTTGVDSVTLETAPGYPLIYPLTATAPAQVTIDGRLIETDPDYVGGQIGELRVQLGLRTRSYRDGNHRLIEEGNLVNTVDDETDQTNYRMVVDYLSSIWISWLNNRQYFELPTPKHVQPFFGTQLVLISRALSVVAEKVNELRFALDSVFIGPSERQALELRFPERIKLLGGEEELVPSKAMFLEDLLNWVYSFSTEEGPRLIQTAGRYGVRDSFFPVAQTLHILVHSSKDANGGTVHGFKTARVRRAIDELSRQLKFLTDMAKPIRSPMRLPESAQPATGGATGTTH